MNFHLKHFKDLIEEYQLALFGQEVLSDYIIGLDGQHRVLLIVPVTATDRHYLVHLDHVKSCSVKKNYGTIKTGALKKYRLEHFLQSVSLHFEIKGEPAVEIPFYHHHTHHEAELPKLEQKARDWEAMLSKMLHAGMEKRA